MERKLPARYMTAYNGLYGAKKEKEGDSKGFKLKASPKPRKFPKEDSEHIRCVTWMRKLHIPHHHSPNGGWRSQRAGAKFKAMGTSPGFPDIFIPIAKAPFHGMFCELKAMDGKTTPPQDAWLALLRSNGYYACIAYGFEQFVTMVSDYLQIARK